MRKKAVILGTGESAKNYKQDLFDFVLGINDAVKLGYKLDAICFVDKWKRVINTRPKVLKTDKFTEKICKYGDCPLPYSKQIESVKHVMNGSFTVDRKPISHGSSSALYAVCICAYYGYKEIELYGIDLVNHESMGFEFTKRGVDIDSVPTLDSSGFTDAKKWASKYSLHNSVLELRLVRKYLEKKGIKMRLTEHSPISKIVNND